jgi:YVTN family beta-propeller protein
MGNRLSTGEHAAIEAKAKVAEETVTKSSTQLYVINNAADHAEVLVVDAGTYQVITTIKVGGEVGCFAAQLILNAAGTRLYVASYNKKQLDENGKIFVIDTNNCKVIAEIDVDKVPRTLLLSRTRLYVANMGSNTISIIATSIFQKIRTIHISTSPGSLALNVAGTQLYVAGGNTLFVIDTVAYRLIMLIGVGPSPKALLLNPAETQLYVACKGNNTVYVINTATYQVTTIDVGDSPRSLALNSAETQLYVENKGSGEGGSISVIDIDTNTDTYQVHETMLRYGCPKILAINLARTQLYVVGYVAGSPGWHFFVIDANTHQVINTIRVFVSPLQQVMLPRALVLDAAERRFHVINSAGGDIRTIDTVSRQVTMTSEIGKSLRDIVIRKVVKEAVTKNSPRLYVINNAEDHAEVLVINADTYELITRVTVGYFAARFVLNSAGTRLYVASYNRKKLNENGKVFVIDTNSYKVISEIDVGKVPRILLLNSGNILYAVNRDSNTISIIDTSSLRKITTILMAKIPVRLLLNPAKNLLYVANSNKEAGMVSVINTVTNKIIKRIGFVDPYPKELLLNSAGTRLYVAHKGGNTVSVIDTDIDYRVIAKIDVGPLGSFPRRLFLNSTETLLYVENKGCGDRGDIAVIDMGSYAIQSCILEQIYPKILAVNSAKTRLYAVSYVESRPGWHFFIIDANTKGIIKAIFMAVPLQQTQLPRALVLNSAERWFHVVSKGGGDIHTIDITSQMTLTFEIGQSLRDIIIREG